MYSEDMTYKGTCEQTDKVICLGCFAAKRQKKIILLAKIDIFAVNIDPTTVRRTMNRAPVLVTLQSTTYASIPCIPKKTLL